MDKKFLFTLGCMVTVSLMIICLVWIFVFNYDPIHPERMSPCFGLVWCIFWGASVVIACQGTWKTLPSGILTAACGPIYGFILYTVIGLMIMNGIHPKLAFMLGAFPVTFALCIIHMVILGNTPFNNVPALLGTYGIWFALKNPVDPSNKMWLWGALAFMFGLVYATSLVPLTLWVLGKLAKPSSVGEVSKA